MLFRIPISQTKRRVLWFVELLTILFSPVNAAMVFSGDDNESVSIVAISNLPLFDGNKVLTLEVTPQKYYKGEVLKSFANVTNGLDAVKVGKKSTGIYFEMKQMPPQNVDCPGNCWMCWGICCETDEWDNQQLYQGPW